MPGKGCCSPMGSLGPSLSGGDHPQLHPLPASVVAVAAQHLSESGPLLLPWFLCPCFNPVISNAAFCSRPHVDIPESYPSVPHPAPIHRWHIHVHSFSRQPLSQGYSPHIYSGTLNTGAEPTSHFWNGFEASLSF